MAWFKKTLKKISKSKFGKAMDTFSAVFSNPIKSIKAIGKKTTIKQVTKEHFEKPLGTQIAKTIGATVGYASLVVGGGAVGAAAKAGRLRAGGTTIIRSLVPKTVKGKVVAAVAAPVVVGAVARQPGKAVSAVVSAPGELAQFGGDVSSFIADPSKETFKEIITESPLISAGLAATGLVAAGAVVAPAISGALQRREMKKQTEALEALSAGALTAPTQQIIPEKAVVTDTTPPALPETTTVTTGTTRRRRYKTKKTPSIRQSVRVNVLNRPINTGIRITNKRYIKERLLN